MSADEDFPTVLQHKQCSEDIRKAWEVTDIVREVCREEMTRRIVAEDRLERALAILSRSYKQENDREVATALLGEVTPPEDEAKAETEDPWKGRTRWS